MGIFEVSGRFQFFNDAAVGIISTHITSTDPMRGAVAITSAKAGCASLAGGAWWGHQTWHWMEFDIDTGAPNQDMSVGESDMFLNVFWDIQGTW